MIWRKVNFFRVFGLEPDFRHLALLKWALENQEVLVEAARRIVKFVICDHIRTAHYAEVDFAKKMINNIIDQLKIFQSVKPGVYIGRPLKSHAKRPRGRPRKQKVPEPQDDLVWGPRTRGMNAQLSGVSHLLAGPSFTTSPIKSTPKVGFCAIAIRFSTEVSQRRRTSDGSTSPTEYKKRKKGAPELTAFHSKLKISPENKTGHFAESVPSIYLQGFTSCCYSKPGVRPLLWSPKRYIKSGSTCSN